MTSIALCAAMALPGEDDAPEWVHLLPAGSVTTVDGRGPYRVENMAAVIAASLQATRGKLPLDECHSTDRAATLGSPAPARGWIVELQSRADGLWGRVEWNPQGRAIMADKQYRGVSPAIVHDKANRITAVLRASLINTPNIVGLTSLHSAGTAVPDGAGQQLAFQARTLQADLARAGLSISYGEAFRCVADEQQTALQAEASVAAMDPAVIAEKAKVIQADCKWRLGVDVTYTDAVQAVMAGEADAG